MSADLYSLLAAIRELTPQVPSELPVSDQLRDLEARILLALDPRKD